MQQIYSVKHLKVLNVSTSRSSLLICSICFHLWDYIISYKYLRNKRSFNWTMWIWWHEHPPRAPLRVLNVSSRLLLLSWTSWNFPCLQRISSCNWLLFLISCTTWTHAGMYVRSLWWKMTFQKVHTAWDSSGCSSIPSTRCLNKLKQSLLLKRFRWYGGRTSANRNVWS